MTVRSNFPVGSPQYNQVIEETATRGAEALQKMSQPEQKAILDALPGRLPDITRTLQKRVLSRSADQLTKMIEAGQHAEPTFEAGDRLAELRDAVTEEKSPRIMLALEEIAQAGEVSPGVFDRLVQRLELIAELSGKDLAMVPAPTREKIQSLANGDMAALPKLIAEELGHYAYKPLGDAVNQAGSG